MTEKTSGKGPTRSGESQKGLNLRDRNEPGPKRLLAPTDLTPGSRKATEYAVWLAEHFQASLTLLHVCPAPAFDDYWEEKEEYAAADAIRQDVKNALESLRSDIKRENVQIDTMVGCGKPEEEIVATARELDVDLIVLSTHNYHWFSRLLHGSDAEGVLKRAPCPILIVRRQEQMVG